MPKAKVNMDANVETEEDPKNKVWFPKKPYDPVRFAINGVQDTRENLKSAIKASDLHAGLKAFLCDELDKFQTNAGELHLHDHELLDNAGKVVGFTVSITGKCLALGGQGKIAARKMTNDE